MTERPITRQEFFDLKRALETKEDRTRTHALQVRVDGLERVHFLVLEELRAVHGLLDQLRGQDAGQPEGLPLVRDAGVAEG